MRGAGAGLFETGEVDQRVSFGKGIFQFVGINHDTGQGEAWDFQPLAHRRQFAGPLPHHGGTVDGALTGDDKIGASHLLRQMGASGEEGEAGFEFCAQERSQAETETTRGAGSNRLVTFRGDNDKAWRHAETFIVREILDHEEK